MLKLQQNKQLRQILGKVARRTIEQKYSIQSVFLHPVQLFNNKLFFAHIF